MDNSRDQSDDGRGPVPPIASSLLKLSDLAARWEIREIGYALQELRYMSIPRGSNFRARYRPARIAEIVDWVTLVTRLSRVCVTPLASVMCRGMSASEAGSMA
jgi:hypothetical protein